MREPISQSLRRAIFARDGGVCQYCGAVITGQYWIDHVLPCCRGGETAPYNLVLACVTCNQLKHADVDEPRNLDIICAGHPEHAPLIRTLIEQGIRHHIAPEPLAKRGQRMRELWANPEWVAARKHRRRNHQEAL